MALKQKAPTMRDVAKAAAVSVQTVSAIVNNKPGITQATRDRVLAVVEQLGYRPYAVARSLRTRQTRTIALILPDIANPFFATIASAAEDYAYRFGYSLILYNTHDDESRENSLIQSAIQSWVDGVLLVSISDQLFSLNALQTAGITTVVLERVPEGYNGALITIDNVLVGRLATEHLLDLGHSKIACIHGPLRLRLARERVQGYQQALANYQLPSGPIVGENGNWSFGEGYDAMQRIMREAPDITAVFAANDRMAMGAIRAIHDAGWRVPEHFSVVGVDDVQVASFYTPTLTTIRQPFDEIGRLGVELLLNILENKPVQQMQITIQPELVVRESTGYKS